VPQKLQIKLRGSGTQLPGPVSKSQRKPNRITSPSPMLQPALQLEPELVSHPTPHPKAKPMLQRTSQLTPQETPHPAEVLISPESDPEMTTLALESIAKNVLTIKQKQATNDIYIGSVTTDDTNVDAGDNDDYVNAPAVNKKNLSFVPSIVSSPNVTLQKAQLYGVCMEFYGNGDFTIWKEYSEEFIFERLRMDPEILVSHLDIAIMTALCDGWNMAKFVLSTDVTLSNDMREENTIDVARDALRRVFQDEMVWRQYLDGLGTVDVDGSFLGTFFKIFAPTQNIEFSSIVPTSEGFGKLQEEHMSAIKDLTKMNMQTEWVPGMPNKTLVLLMSIASGLILITTMVLLRSRNGVKNKDLVKLLDASLAISSVHGDEQGKGIKNKKVNFAEEYRGSTEETCSDRKGKKSKRVKKTEEYRDSTEETCSDSDRKQSNSSNNFGTRNNSRATSYNSHVNNNSQATSYNSQANRNPPSCTKKTDSNAIHTQNITEDDISSRFMNDPPSKFMQHQKDYGSGFLSAMTSVNHMRNIGGKQNTSSKSRMKPDFVTVTVKNNIIENLDGSRSELLICTASPGKLGIVIDTPSNGPPVVHSIKDGSPLAKTIFTGDRLISVDKENVTAMTAIAISNTIEKRNHNPERILKFVRGGSLSSSLSIAPSV